MADAEWPDNDEPLDYWISNLPAETSREYMAVLARMRWKIELDYRELKGQLGLDHYEGRSWLGWYHHTALVTAAHGFLTLEGPAAPKRSRGSGRGRRRAGVEQPVTEIGVRRRAT